MDVPVVNVAQLQAQSAPGCAMMNGVHPMNEMSILQSIIEIDSQFVNDADGVIDATGITIDGRQVDVWIQNDGSGPVVFPGASFLPYGGIVYNQLLTSITAD